MGGDIGKDSSKEPAGSEVSLPRLSDIVFPRGTPLWAVQALEMLKPKVLGVEWSRVVHSWVTFQIAKGLTATKPIFAPTSDLMCKITDVASSLWEFGPCEEFQEPFWAWWANLQPERHVEGLEDDFTDLKCRWLPSPTSFTGGR